MKHKDTIVVGVGARYGHRGLSPPPEGAATRAECLLERPEEEESPLAGKLRTMIFVVQQCSDELENAQAPGRRLF